MITTVTAQLKYEKEPREHIALVFDDAQVPADLAVYRDAAIAAAKAIVSVPELGGCMDQDIFWLLQFAEFINVSLSR